MDYEWLTAEEFLEELKPKHKRKVFVKEKKKEKKQELVEVSTENNCGSK